MPFSHPSPPAPWSSPWGLACPQLPRQPADSSRVLLPVPPWDFFPDHLFSVFSISKDGIPGLDHLRPGPSQARTTPRRCLSSITTLAPQREAQDLHQVTHLFCHFPIRLGQGHVTPADLILHICTNALSRDWTSRPAFSPISLEQISSMPPHPTQILSPRYR